MFTAKILQNNQLEDRTMTSIRSLERNLATQQADVLEEVQQQYAAIFRSKPQHKKDDKNEK